MEKTISIRGSEITFSIWDLGGKLRYFLHFADLLERSTRVCKYVTPCLQRCSSNFIYV